MIIFGSSSNNFWDQIQHGTLKTIFFSRQFFGYSKNTLTLFMQKKLSDPQQAPGPQDQETCLDLPLPSPGEHLILILILAWFVLLLWPLCGSLYRGIIRLGLTHYQRRVFKEETDLGKIYQNIQNIHLQFSIHLISKYYLLQWQAVIGTHDV